MSFDPFLIDLPVTEIIPKVKEHLNNGNTLIVNAPPGAGKSTLLPLALMNESWLSGKKILMLEPRRLAAKTIAARMSDLLGEKTGTSVGYRIRFETCISKQTQIEVLTEGILSRMILSDNSLQDVAMVVFDEFHERSIYADVALALCREAQKRYRPDLKILIMSATLDMPQLTTLLQAPAVVSQGRQYPVEVFYAGKADERMLPEMAAKTVRKAVKEQQGDCLVFLPGQGEIRECESILRKELKDFVIHPLYGQLPPNKQFAAIMPDKQGRRKIVLATSIAETSLTIEGITIVVDSGFGRTSLFDPNSGLSRLETIRISKDSADQRAGRAGRLSPGTCYRMWSEAEHEQLQEHSIPEIMEADLADLVLDMAHWGIADIRSLTWLNPPPKAHLAQANETLYQLNALENGQITEHGKRMHGLPCHPRIAHMLLMAEADNKLGLASDLAAMLEERDPLPKESGVDINLRIEALRRYRREKSDNKRFDKIEKIAESYRKLFSIKEDNRSVDSYETGVILAYAYPERIAFARPGNNAQFKMANGQIAFYSHKDDLANESWVSVANVDARQGMGKIFLASPLNPKDLMPLVKEKDNIKWDTETGELKASKDLCIGNIVLKSKPLPRPADKFLPKAISEAIRREGEMLLPFNEEITQWQNRVLSLRKWRSSEGWPDVSTSSLLITNEEWLMPHLNEIETPDDLFEIDLLSILEKLLENDLRINFSQLAPSSIELPIGEYAINYQSNGSNPVIEIPLNKALGWNSHVYINNNKVPVVYHLINPAGKTVVETTNLSSFWKDDYPEMKRDLKAKFPSFQWDI